MSTKTLAIKYFQFICLRINIKSRRKLLVYFLHKLHKFFILRNLGFHAPPVIHIKNFRLVKDKPFFLTFKVIKINPALMKDILLRKTVVLCPPYRHIEFNSISGYEAEVVTS